MFKRRWIWFGDLVSDEGFSLKCGNRTIVYTDGRGSFEFGLEDGLLFPNPKQVAEDPVGLKSDADIMLKNGDVIEVKSGGGKGATSQVVNQTKIIGDSGEVFVYGPKLKPSVIKSIQNAGTKVFTSLDDLVAYIKSKGL